MVLPALLCLALYASLTRSQPEQPVPNSFPHVYPGQPSGDLSPAWQNYFEVKDALPNITFTLPRSFAGNIPVNRAGHPNDTLFFWAFEKQNGSLTTNSSSDPWLIWLQGGPGSASTGGLLVENGPMHIQDDLSMKENNFTWAKLVDAVWVDNPVGTGFATADNNGGYVVDDDQMGTDFVQFLSNLVKVFPSLATRPLYITGESYAGRWIPYITKAIFSTPNPPVKLRKIAIGDGTIPSGSVFTDLNTVTIIETYPQVVNYDTDVLTYFREQTHLCGYDLNLTYPQSGGFFPTLQAPSATDPNSPFFFTSGSPPSADQRLAKFSSLSTLDSKLKKRAILEYARHPMSRQRKRSVQGGEAMKREVEREAKRQLWKRDLSLRANGTVDPWYACNLQEELYEYMINFTAPWSSGSFETFDVYDLTDGLVAKPPTSPAINLNPIFYTDNRTISAIHAPTSRQWIESFPYPFNSTSGQGDPSPDPIVFMNELAANASAQGVGIVIYSGNDDSLVPHRGSEVAIQNTTFGGTQGFSRQPSTPWFDDDGNFAGIIHQERNWTFVLFDGASHLVPQKKPAQAFVFLREFVLGSNQTGLVVNSSGTVSVVGGEASPLPGDVLPGTSVIFGGSISTTTTFTYPAATVSQWDAFVSSVNANDAAAKPTTTKSAALKLKILSPAYTFSVAVMVLLALG